jgi:hypothetical protein
MRRLAIAAFPLAYLLFGFLAFAFAGHAPNSMASVGMGDVSAMLLPSVLIYLVSLAFLFRRLTALNTWELLVFSMSIGVLTLLFIALTVYLAYQGGNSQGADFVFFFLAPFAPPVAAILVCYKGALAWKRRRASAHF